MIQSFKHKGLRDFFLKGDSSKLYQSHLRRLQLILAKLNAGVTLADMDFSGSGLHQLKGDMKEIWALTVNGNWRIIYRFDNGDVFDVDYVDYH